MDRNRPGGDPDKPGMLPSDFDDWTAAQRGGFAAPPDQPPADQEPVSSDQRHRFSVQFGGSQSFTGAAERIGGALGSAHRQLRHGLEVVGEETRLHQSDQPPGLLGWNSRRAGDPLEEDDIAARMMWGIEDAVAELRRHAAGRLISLQRPAEIPPQPQSARADPCGLLQDFLTRLQQRTRRLAAEKPIEIAAALLALGLAFGAALRLRKSHL